ncbi:MAG TPA: DUF1080 domain-containing protein [Tepidisphaeraceae bacterium]|nr:DUF1080 domain-containing protein [Tepidisphaeraceae bacterium]
MKMTAKALVSALLVVLVGAAKDEAGDEQGFVKLFNGKDLTGWVHAEKAGKGYQVQDAVLFCTENDGGKLFTEKEYADFVFRFEFKLEPNGNNGIGIRSPMKGDPAYVAMEIQVLDDYGPEYKEKLRPAQYHGSIYDVVPAKRGSLKPAGEWNSEEITARGRQITVKLNGETIVDANLDDIKDPNVLKKHPGLANKRGRIGLLGHGTRVEFRNLRVKPLE